MAFFFNNSKFGYTHTNVKHNLFVGVKFDGYIGRSRFLGGHLRFLLPRP